MLQWLRWGSPASAKPRIRLHSDSQHLRLCPLGYATSQVQPQSPFNSPTPPQATLHQKTPSSLAEVLSWKLTISGSCDQNQTDSTQQGQDKLPEAPQPLQRDWRGEREWVSARIKAKWSGFEHNLGAGSESPVAQTTPCWPSSKYDRAPR